MMTILTMAASLVLLDTLPVSPEERCAPYEAASYRYPSTYDIRHVEAQGYQVDTRRRISGERNPDYGRIDHAFPSPYTPGISFRYVQDMDIEHIVARSEAHDSGLCARPDQWTPFATDPRNLTVAGEHVNRALKSDRDAAEWLPDINVCWYARTVIEVKLKYGLSVDYAERDALWAALEDCE